MHPIHEGTELPSEAIALAALNRTTTPLRDLCGAGLNPETAAHTLDDARRLHALTDPCGFEPTPAHLT